MLEQMHRSLPVYTTREVMMLKVLFTYLSTMIVADVLAQALEGAQ